MIGGPLGTGAERKRHRWNDRGQRKPLTDREHDVMVALGELTRGSASGPTVLALAERLSLSVSSTASHVRRLVQKGWVTHTPGAERSVAIIGRRQGVATDAAPRAPSAATSPAPIADVREVRAC